MENHSDYVSPWLQALQYGLTNGRPYSDHCTKLYKFQMEWFFKQYPELSITNLKLALVSIPIEQFSKRLKLFEAATCFSKFLAEDGLLAEDFPNKIKPFRPRRHLPPKKLTVSLEDIQRLKNVAKTPTDRLLIILLSQTGLRASEAANLLLDDINLEEGYLIVRRAKWGKTRRVGLTQEATDALRDFLDQRQHPNNPNLMTKINGKPMDRNGIITRIYKMARLINKPVSPHALRRAFVTINANKGRPLPMLQIACGHSNITTTRSYCMTTEDETIEAMKSWN